MPIVMKNGLIDPFFQRDIAEKLRAYAQNHALRVNISGDLCPEPLEGDVEELSSPLCGLLDGLKACACNEILIEAAYQPDRNWYDVQLMFCFEGRSKGQALLWHVLTRQNQLTWEPVLQRLQGKGWHVTSPFSATPEKIYCSITCPLAAAEQ
jgi:hypothetical protein